MVQYQVRPRKTVTIPTELAAQIVCLLNDYPRFMPRDRRLHIDSYQVAADLSQWLKIHHFDPQELIANLPRE